MDSRAVSPVIEKLVAMGLVVLFVSGFTGTLLGGTVPDYRAGAGQEVAERTLATAARTVDDAVTGANGTVRARATRELPGTIADASYRIELRGRGLHLVHPDPAIGASTRVAVPASVTVRNSTWHGGPFVVAVGGPAANRSLRLGGA